MLHRSTQMNHAKLASRDSFAYNRIKHQPKSSRIVGCCGAVFCNTLGRFQYCISQCALVQAIKIRKLLLYYKLIVTVTLFGVGREARLHCLLAEHNRPAYNVVV